MYLQSPGSAIFAATHSSSGDWTGFATVFLFAGFIFYGLMFLRYRNIGKRHHHERETATHKANMIKDDVKTERRTGLEDSRMRGANNRKVAGTPQMFGLKGFITEAVAKVRE